MRLVLLLLCLTGFAAASAQSVPPAATPAGRFAQALPTLPTVRPNARAGAPFNRLRYDKVVAFDYAGGKGEGAGNIIGTNGQLAPTVRQWKALTQAQADALTAFISAPATYGAGTAFCFEPHLGVVFYHQGRVVAHLSICLECNRLSASPAIPATSRKKIYISDQDSYPAEGFSKQGRRQLNGLCQQLGFSHCLDQLNSMFDE